MSDEIGYRERARATQWAENHPIRDGVRQAIFHALCRLIDDDRVFYWSVLRLRWRTGFAQSTITTVLAEFAVRGMLEDTGERKGKGGTRVYKLHYERSTAAYPDSADWETFKARTERERAQSEADSRTKVHREPVKFNGTEPHREPVRFMADTARDSHAQDAPNFTDPRGELHQSGVRTSPDEPTELHRLSPQTSTATGDKVLEGLTEGFEENTEDAHRRWPSPVSQAKPGPHDEARSVANGSDAAPQKSSPDFPHNRNRRRQIRAVPVFCELDEVQRVRVDDLLDTLAAACELPANGNAQRRVAFGIARLVACGFSYATLRGEIDRLREARVKVTWSKVLAAWTKLLAAVGAQFGYATGSSEMSDDEIRECGYAFVSAMEAQAIVCEPQWRINERCRDLIARGATLGMLPEAIRRARAKAQARKVPIEARALSVCDALAEMLAAVRTNQPTGTGDPACVDDLVAQFRKFCDEGLCSWPTYAGEQASMREGFGRLMRERGATADTVCEAYLAARGSIAKGKRPGARAILRAMDNITRGKAAGKPPVKDKIFFHRPALEAGEPEARRVTRDLLARLMKTRTDGASS